MSKSKLARVAACLMLCLAVFGGLMTRQVASADSEEETTPPPDSIQVIAKYPVVSGAADTQFKFEVDFKYRGKTARDFDLRVTIPQGWFSTIQKSAYDNMEISAIHLEPYSISESVVVIAVAPFWLFPEPGRYPLELEVVSEDLQATVNLEANITARYSFDVKTESGRLNTKTTAGDEAHLSIIVTNTGTATLDKVTLSASKPAGIANEEWRVTFSPDKVEDLAPADQKVVEVTIQPPSKTIAGDYMATLNFDSDPDPSVQPPKLDIRVTVTTSTRWGWIGAGIVVAVIAGLVVGFKQFGRR